MSLRSFVAVAWFVVSLPGVLLAQTPVEVERVDERLPLDSLDGPPFVTARAWAIADGRTGELLWGEQESTARAIASTTKIMTALLVLELADDDPKLLDEVVTFSKRADGTGGSTAGIRAGERLSVRELLYGLLLPSGNDAAVALAEQFGDRVPVVPSETASEAAGDDAGEPRPDEKDEKGNAEKEVDPDDPLPRFVAAMNHRATTLGMLETRYLDPHGNSANRASPRDLLKLARAALSNERFRAYVETRDHRCTLERDVDDDDADAAAKMPEAIKVATREAEWRNTNQLLARHGYDGVKTGTTGAAGACLVSSSHRPRADGESDHLLIVVLGSTSSDARYVDTRNLYRWAWLQRGHGSQETARAR